LEEIAFHTAEALILYVHYLLSNFAMLYNGNVVIIYGTSSVKITTVGIHRFAHCMQQYYYAFLTSIIYITCTELTLSKTIDKTTNRCLAFNLSSVSDILSTEFTGYIGAY
jgi:hypothetical protein